MGEVTGKRTKWYVQFPKQSQAYTLKLNLSFMIQIIFYNQQVVTDGHLKSTTATTIDSGGISPKASTDQMDPKLSGKASKKSNPSAKKPNKRGTMQTSWFG